MVGTARVVAEQKRIIIAGNNSVDIVPEEGVRNARAMTSGDWKNTKIVTKPRLLYNETARGDKSSLKSNLLDANNANFNGINSSKS